MIPLYFGPSYWLKRLTRSEESPVLGNSHWETRLESKWSPAVCVLSLPLSPLSWADVYLSSKIRLDTKTHSGEIYSPLLSFSLENGTQPYYPVIHSHSLSPLSPPLSPPSFSLSPRLPSLYHCLWKSVPYTCGGESEKSLPTRLG